MSKELITLKTGNTSWWKNKKYRREATLSIKEFRKKGYKLKKIKTYRLNGPNTLIYSDYWLYKL
jgi:type I site-specific restriction endonuclease